LEVEIDKNVTWWSDRFEMMRAAVKIELKTRDKRPSPKITIVICLIVLKEKIIIELPGRRGW
jgi:hypothetical protein